jgi:hypothetical protein
MSTVHRATRWTVAAVVAGSLGFGATQAFAAPSAATENRLICTTTNCPQIICKCQNGQCVDRQTGVWCFA